MKVASLVGLAVMSIVPSAFAQWSDGFESYAVGILPPQGGWTDFGGTQTINVSGTQVHSGTKSMRLREGTTANDGYGSDVFYNFNGGVPITAGTWNFSWWQFMQGDTVSFMFVTTGVLPATFNTGLDLRADPSNVFGLGNSLLAVQADPNAPDLKGSAPIVQNRWVEHSITVNLDANKYDYSYDGAALVTNGVWTYSGTPALGGFNFWMQLHNTDTLLTFTYFDDFNLVLVPAPGAAGLLGLGGLLMARRRRA